MVRFSVRAKVFSLVQTGSGGPFSSCCMGTEALSREIKRTGREGDHSPPSTEVKNEWDCIFAQTRKDKCVHNFLSREPRMKHFCTKVTDST